MKIQQADLLADDTQLHALIDRIDTVDEETLQPQWPQLLAALVDVMDNELQRQGFTAPQSRPLARKMAAALAAYAGGRNYYLPKGDSLLTALRDDEIFHRWQQGTPIETLRKAYRLGQIQIYKVIATQRQRYVKRTQPALFAD
ncbi:Mor transcription activator family protein [Arsenophonus sp. PmNCSU2021_1]|uniref:Mor transcription activator family protein n=1 Tax=Arsenophonus sp. PmNCSU2021_1 TaxID=3118989 RepID=UPI002FF209DC